MSGFSGLPMMATPVAIGLVWTMMFHPQLGVLNYLLTSVGLPPSSWVYDSTTIIPTLVMVETWQWTPLVLLIVLGGIASLPTDPYEAAILDARMPGKSSGTSPCRWCGHSSWWRRSSASSMP
ncbi:MAG: sugar ABC transporter permease [Acetobacteraceae bacterium]|nr:sugar ABC transporter permease [Acetobacteraceae bacterium]